MTVTPKPKKAQKPWFDLCVFAAVLAFFVYSARTILAFHQRGTKAAETAEEKTETNIGRAPASQAPARGKLLQGSTEVLRLPCLTQAERALGSNARLVQIHAPACGDDAEQAAAWKAANETSGEEILVFVNAKDKTFATSYFSLKEGVNKLVFTHQKRKGEAKIVKLEITRKGGD